MIFKFQISIIFFLLFSMNFQANSQNIKTDSITVYPQNGKDISDYYNKIFKKKPVLKDSTKNQTLGPFVTPIVYPGYAIVTKALVGAACNVAFYTHLDNEAKISNILADIVYTQNKQSINAIRSNIWLNHEKYNLLGDWRFYKFPAYTYGLGSKNSLNDAIPVDYSHIRVYEVMMKQIKKNMFAGIGYSLDYHWNIKKTDLNAKNESDLDQYTFKNTSASSGITFNFQFDNRLNSNNPAKGTFINLQLKDNLRALYSNSNWHLFTIDFRKYVQLSKITGNRLSFWSYNLFTLAGKPPYFDLPATGWDTFNNTARGYIEGRFRGKNLMYFETEYRFRLLENGFLGGVLFANANTVSEIESQKFEKINPALGAGLRIKLNKKSDTNLTLDYAKGTGGSGGFAFGVNEMF